MKGILHVKLIKTLMAAGLAGCAPMKEQTQSIRIAAQCHVDVRAAEALRRDWAEIAADLERGTPDDIRSAAGRMAALLGHPVFHTQEGRPAVDVSADPRALVEWWKRGGDSWAKDRLHQSPSDIESPPTIRSIIDSGAVPEEILCTSPVCDPKALGFIDTVVAWGLEFEAYERGRFFDGGSGLSGLNRWQEQCGVNSGGEWLDCVSRRRSARAELPIGDYRFPTSGWFFVSRSVMSSASCPSYLGVNLESGDVVSANDCDVRGGRGSVERFREFALLTLLAGEAEDISQWQRFEAPAGVDVSGTCSLDSAPPVLKVKNSDRERLSFWWWRDGGIVTKGIRRTDAHDEPASELAFKLLLVAEYTVVDGSVSLPDQIGSTDQQLGELLSTLRRH